MHLFFEEDGGFKVGTVLETSGAPEPTSYQVELPTGRRIKLKASNVVFSFVQPGPADLMRDAESIARDIDVGFLWEVAPHEEFEFDALGADYFGAAASSTQSAALLLALQGSPMYFRRRGRGRYRPAPEQELKAALAGLEKRKQLAAQQDALVETLLARRLPAAWSDSVGAAHGPSRAAFLLFKPDKNSIEYKALDQAARQLQCSPLRLLFELGAFANGRDLHRASFLVEWFPRGTGFDAVDVPSADQSIADLPLAPVNAFSIDDSQTTEIDDAFSVQWPDAETVRVGVHIAAPGLAFGPGEALDAIARKRLSTVYMPGEKITMLPDSVVQAFTLGEGEPRPALSLYADFDRATGTCAHTETRLERVPVAANLRHDKLDAIVTEASLADDETAFAFKAELQSLWTLAQALTKQREAVRGKPEPRNRADFNFRIELRDDVEHVVIDQRRRDAPLDRVVAEWMIFANSTWGRLLDDAGIAAIYRTQTSFARPGARQSSVRMTTHAAPHLGLGVTHYAWSSSPLRRYIDLVNQWQLIAWARAQGSARDGSQADDAVHAPFAKNSADLFAIIGAFDAAYSAYAEVQGRLERYWCLRWLAQEGRVGTGHQVDAVVLRNETVRLSDVPLASRMAGIGHLAPGTRITVEVVHVDELDLALELRLATVLTEDVQTDEAQADVDALAEESAYDPLIEAATEEDSPVDTLADADEFTPVAPEQTLVSDTTSTVGPSQ